MLRFFAGLAGCFLLTTSAAAQTVSPGLPMWVIRDEDSTIYLTGTIHAVRPGLPWRSAKVEAALAEATELWLEIAEVGEIPQMDLSLVLSSRPPLSSRLSAEENSLLQKAMGKAELPEGMMAAIERMKPGVVMYLLALNPAALGDLSYDLGIDAALKKAAQEQGDAVKGFETVEQQMSFLLAGTEDEQLSALKAYLRDADGQAEGLRRLVEGSEDWANGRTAGIEASNAWMAQQPQVTVGGRPQMKILLDDRNEAWAGQIVEILKGKGVVFIAVGAGHLVGEASVQERLKARGITAVRH